MIHRVYKFSINVCGFFGVSACVPDYFGYVRACGCVHERGSVCVCVGVSECAYVSVFLCV